jgi:hypothetical protein
MEIIDYSVLYTFSLVSWNQFLKLSKPCTVCVIPLSNKYMYTYIYTAKVYLAKVVDRKLHVLWGWVGLNLVATSALLISTLLLQWVTNEDTVHCLQIVLSNRVYWKESAMLRLHYTSLQIYMRLHYFAWTSRVESSKYHRKAAKCHTLSLCKWIGINVTKLVNVQYLGLQPRLRLHNRSATSHANRSPHVR